MRQVGDHIALPTQCYLCGKIMLGMQYRDWAGHGICASHINSVDHCASCGAFCNNQARDIGNGMKICAHCLGHRVEKENAKQIIKFINDIYEKSPVGKISSWHLMMVDAATLYGMLNDKNARGLAKMVGSDYTIYIFRELSRVTFAQVLAHEMLHVYQYINNINPPSFFCEGFCNLGSYVVLKAIGNDEAKGAINGLQQSPDPIYGDGFRHMLSLYESGGWTAALKEIRNA